MSKKVWNGAPCPELEVSNFFEVQEQRLRPSQFAILQGVFFVPSGLARLRPTQGLRPGLSYSALAGLFDSDLI